MKDFCDKVPTKVSSNCSRWTSNSSTNNANHKKKSFRKRNLNQKNKSLDSYLNIKQGIKNRCDFFSHKNISLPLNDRYKRSSLSPVLSIDTFSKDISLKRKRKNSIATDLNLKKIKDAEDIAPSFDVENKRDILEEKQDTELFLFDISGKKCNLHTKLSNNSLLDENMSQKTSKKKSKYKTANEALQNKEESLNYNEHPEMDVPKSFGYSRDGLLDIGNCSSSKRKKKKKKRKIELIKEATNKNKDETNLSSPPALDKKRKPKNEATDILMDIRDSDYEMFSGNLGHKKKKKNNASFETSATITPESTPREEHQRDSDSISTFEISQRNCDEQNNTNLSSPPGLDRKTKRKNKATDFLVDIRDGECEMFSYNLGHKKMNESFIYNIYDKITATPKGRCKRDAGSSIIYEISQRNDDELLKNKDNTNLCSPPVLNKKKKQKNKATDVLVDIRDSECEMFSCNLGHKKEKKIKKIFKIYDKIRAESTPNERYKRDAGSSSTYEISSEPSQRNGDELLENKDNTNLSSPPALDNKRKQRNRATDILIDIRDSECEMFSYNLGHKKKNKINESFKITAERTPKEQNKRDAGITSTNEISQRNGSRLRLLNQTDPHASFNQQNGESFKSCQTSENPVINLNNTEKNRKKELQSKTGTCLTKETTSKKKDKEKKEHEDLIDIRDSECELMCFKDNNGIKKKKKKCQNESNKSIPETILNIEVDNSLENVLKDTSYSTDSKLIHHSPLKKKKKKPPEPQIMEIDREMSPKGNSIEGEGVTKEYNGGIFGNDTLEVINLNNTEKKRKKKLQNKTGTCLTKETTSKKKNKEKKEHEDLIDIRDSECELMCFKDYNCIKKKKKKCQNEGNKSIPETILNIEANNSLENVLKDTSYSTDSKLIHHCPLKKKKEHPELHIMEIDLEKSPKENSIEGEGVTKEYSGGIFGNDTLEYEINGTNVGDSKKGCKKNKYANVNEEICVQNVDLIYKTPLLENIEQRNSFDACPKKKKPKTLETLGIAPSYGSSNFVTNAVGFSDEDKDGVVEETEKNYESPKVNTVYKKKKHRKIIHNSFCKEMSVDNDLDNISVDIKNNKLNFASINKSSGNKRESGSKVGSTPVVQELPIETADTSLNNLLQNCNGELLLENTNFLNQWLENIDKQKPPSGDSVVYKSIENTTNDLEDNVSSCNYDLKKHTIHNNILYTSSSEGYKSDSSEVITSERKYKKKNSNTYGVNVVEKSSDNYNDSTDAATLEKESKKNLEAGKISNRNSVLEGSRKKRRGIPTTHNLQDIGEKTNENVCFASRELEKSTKSNKNKKKDTSICLEKYKDYKDNSGVMDIPSMLEEDESETEIEEVEDKFRKLDITLPFELPPLHSIMTKTSWLTKEQLEEIKEQNLEVKTGPFSKQEDKMIMENWRCFCKEHNLQMLPSVFTSFPRKMDMEQKVNFLRYLAHGLDNRLLHRVYARFKLIVERPVTKIGRFSTKEDRQIMEFMETTYSHCPFRDLSKILHRPRSCIEKRYNRLKAKPGIIHWTPDLSHKLIKYLKRITKCEKIEDLEHKTVTIEDWKKLSMKMNIDKKKLRRAWENTIYPRLFARDNVNLKEIKTKIVKMLLQRNETDWRTVNWKEIAKRFPGFTYLKIYMMFKFLVNFHVPTSMQHNLKECLDYLNDVLVKYNLIPTPHKFEKILY